ncbi:MAG TPA: CHRD domain-containing protein [Burkholderiales bacterium]|nr:CHRD domain-containing protein [Burkholderiales bacterium]
MKKLSVLSALLLAWGASTTAGAEEIKARLIGYQEVPSVSTPASGEFEAKISRDDGMIEYELSYSGLLGTVQQSHIHFGQRSVNGSIVIWLCQTATTPAPPAVAGLTPFCPQSGTVTGNITAANVITAGTASQQIVAGELAEVIAAIRAGVAYANVHTLPLNPGGEIRGQIRASRHKDKDRDSD